MRDREGSSEEVRRLLERLRRVEIRARGLSHQVFAGEYHSAFKGRGMAFSEVREYQYGDDVRSIDWNVTARFNRPHIKVFEEERELTVMLVIDASGSSRYGSGEFSKRNVMAEIAATLAFSAIQNNDKIGLILFTDRVARFIPPQKGRKHIMRIIWELLGFDEDSGSTDVGEALRYLTHAIKKRCTAFVLSDFDDFEIEEERPADSSGLGVRVRARFEDALSIASRKHDVVALRVYDSLEVEFPRVGLVKLVDMEGGGGGWVDSSSRRVRERFEGHREARSAELRRVFTRSGIDSMEVCVGEDYVVPLLQLFKRRA